MSFGPVSRRTALQWSSAALVGAAISIGPRIARGAIPRVLQDGQKPTDKRLGVLKDLNGYFPFMPSKTPEEWAKTSQQMATLLQFKQKYQGTPYASQVQQRIDLLTDRLNGDAGEVAGKGGLPKPVVPPEQFDMKQLRESDDVLLEKMRTIAGLR